MDSRNWRLGIDIGGTFTDLTVLEQSSGRMITLKTPTVPADPAQGIANGLELLKRQGISPSDIGYFVHGTTIGLNTLLQRRGSKIALLVTEGFRDMLNLQRLRLPVPYDFRSRLPEPLVPRERVFTAEERLLHDGSVHTELNEEKLRSTLDEIRASGATGVVICFLHSYKNPAHENRAAELLAQWSGGELDVSASSALWPQMREYERAVMTSANLYIQANVQRYFSTLQERLNAEGVPSTPFITQSNGGIMDIRSAAQAPVRTLFSGPAAGVIGAAQAARSAGIGNVITFDMGGTSADISIIEDGQPTFSQSNHLAGLPIPLPAVSMYSVGAGGGSYGWIDNGGLLKVGPESVGSDPGPACYGKGELAALTDAFLVCGYLNPDRFAAGNVQLYADRSLTALEPIARHLGMDARSAADRMIQVAIANMYAELSAVMEQHGFDPRDFSLLAFGGGGPVTANFLADEIQARSVLIPPNPGTLCALGALTADFAHDAVLSLQRLAADVPFAQLGGHYAGLARSAGEWLDAQDAPGIEGRTIYYTLDARYKGQAFEIELPVAPELLEDADYTRLEEQFHDLHRRQYGHSDPGAQLELINLRARIVGHVRKPELATIGAAESAVVSSGTRRTLIRGREYDAAVYARGGLRAGHTIQGPAVVEQDDTTIVVLPGWSGRTDGAGNLILEKEAEA
ncbi:hydantoinase/oxoprolinase family protein [Saccharibacillus sp. CPCC 101409]|uniref:hydantoinase/oxoprolinase family protein n=1 Tax=Saccharibacillus sp. CPCC 101409 TaxID=3058041 RepID=UPI002673C716|nr:hydantoinase/oxoprolinase family protein [Saccharibacillus sp. CPCC 101409]MDO3408202.1 hydantoinase/oxoprolinase family protein [Saccharibacillus sp. CPCC 101409]